MNKKDYNFSDYTKLFEESDNIQRIYEKIKKFSDKKYVYVKKIERI